MKRTKKRYLSSFMAMILFASTMTISSVPTVTALAATDTNGHWAESTINKWTASGYISGYPDGTFRPNNAISRAEFVTLANKAFSYNVPTSISFKDLDTSHWAYSEIQKGVSAGYIKGDAAGTFRPGAAVTRQEAAVMMAQIKKLQQNVNSALSYTDYNSIANWAKPYVGAVSDVKIMQGFPNGAFRPQTSMTRAEAVTALENAIFAPTQSSNQSSSSVTTPNYNTNTNSSSNSSSSSNSNSSSSSNFNSSSSASDYTLEDSSLRNRTIDGNLIISSSLGSKDVTLNGVTVKGTVKVQGGSTIKAQSCDFNKVEMDKSGVTLNADSKTKIKNLEFLQRGKIEGSGYENVYVQDSSLSEATVDATVKYLELDTDANLKLYKNADVATLEVTSNAKDGEVTFTSGAEVDDMTIRGRIRIYGRGDINDMTTYVSGIRSSVKPDRVTTRGDGEKPSYTSGESGSSSSSSSSDYDDLTLDREDRKYDADGERYHNVSIEADGVTLRDAIVYNRLTITRDVEDGEVILDDVRVRGDVYIYGGGENSVIFRNCDIQGDIISYKDTDDSRYGDEPVALEFEDDTDVDGDIKVRGDTIIRAESDIKLDNIIVDRKLNEDLIVDAKVNTLKLVADCDVRITGRSKIDKVDINSNRDITLRMETGSYINTIDSNSDLTIRGNGTVKTIRTSKTVTTDSGIVNDDQTSTFVAVTDILGIPSTQASYSLTLSPSVQPTNASYQTVTWSIDSGLNTAGASISNDRVLTATKDGQVRLLATIDNGKAIGTAYTKSFTVTFSYGSGTVTPPEPSTPATVTGIKISPDRTSYAKDEKITLTADIDGTLAKDDAVTWTSSDPETVKVEKKSTDGRDATATILKYGEKEVTITAKVGNETGKTKTIKVSAAPLPKITDIVVAGKNNAKPETAKVNDEFTLTATITDFSGQTVEWRVIEDGGTATSNLVELGASQTTTNSTTVKIKSQKENNTPLTVQARMKGTDNGWEKSSTTKIVVVGSGGGGSTNPPTETAGLSEITATPASINLNDENKTSALSVSITGTNTEGYTVAWSVDNPTIATIAAGTDTKTATLTGAAAGNVTVTAKLMKNGTEVTPKVEKTKTITITSVPPVPPVGGTTLTGIKTNDEAAVSQEVVEIEQPNTVELEAVGTKLDETTIHWKVEGSSEIKSTTGFKDDSDNIVKEITGNRVTLVIPDNEVDEFVMPRRQINVVAWLENNETNRVSRTVNVYPKPTVVGICVGTEQANTQQEVNTGTFEIETIVNPEQLQLKAVGVGIPMPPRPDAVTSKNIKWSISGNEAGTTLSATEGESVNLTFANTEDASADNPVIVKAWVEGKQQQQDAASRSFVFKPHVAGIKAGDEQGAETGNISVGKNGRIELEAIPINLSGETINWSIIGSSNLRENTGFVNTSTGSSISKTATGNRVTLAIASDETETEFTIASCLGNGQQIGMKNMRHVVIGDLTGVALIGIRTTGDNSQDITGVTGLKQGESIELTPVGNDLDEKTITWSIVINSPPQEGALDEKTGFKLDDGSISKTTTSIGTESVTLQAAETESVQMTAERMILTASVDGGGTGKEFSRPVSVHPQTSHGLCDITASLETIDLSNQTTSTISVGLTGVANEDIYSVEWSLNNDNAQLSNENTAFKNNHTQVTLTGTKVGTVEVTAKLKAGDNVESTLTKEITITDNSAASSSVEQPSTFSARQAAPRKMAAVPQAQTAVEKPYVIDITLPTQECEAGKNFDLSQAQLQATGENNFNISWIVGRGYADRPDDTTVRMDRTGSVVMTAVVVGGKADGDVYTKDFEITFTEPKAEPAPVIPEQKEEVPAEPEQKEEVPVVPEQKEEVPAEPEQKEEVPAEPEQKEEVPAEPEQKEEVPVVPEQKEEVPVVPEQKEETSVVPVQPENTPIVPEPPEDKTIVISTKGELMTNNEILLYAKNADGTDAEDTNTGAINVDDTNADTINANDTNTDATSTNYQNAVWSIVKDNGTNSVIEKNVLIAKNTGTVVIKVTIGHGIPRIRTKVIEIAQ